MWWMRWRKQWRESPCSESLSPLQEFLSPCYLISLKSPKCIRQNSAKGVTLTSSPCLHAQLHFKQPWRRASYSHLTTFLCMWLFSSFLYLPLFDLPLNESRLSAESNIFLSSRSLRSVKLSFEHSSVAVGLPWVWGSSCPFTPTLLLSLLRPSLASSLCQ